MKFRKNGKFAEKGKFPSFEKEKKVFKRRDGRTLNPFKESLASNATDMNISRKSVSII